MIKINTASATKEGRALAHPDLYHKKLWGRYCQHYDNTTAYTKASLAMYIRFKIRVSIEP